MYILHYIFFFFLIVPNYCKNNLHSCGYQSCPYVNSHNLNIHLVPHSHLDVGWLKTVDEYFYGWKSNIQNANVSLILDSVVNALSKNRKRRFVFVETAYFWKWWQERHVKVRELVKKLVNNGQLEIVGGGWVLNDEACTHYQPIIDQFTWGFRKLNETLGQCGQPRVAWQIDQFGHSREMASIFSQFGFDGEFMARIDYNDKKARLQDKTLEIIWQGSDNLGKSSNLFTSVFYGHYSAPNGFCFDTLCDNLITDANKQIMAKDFITYAEKHAKSFKTNNIIVPMGDDFNYQNADLYFDSIDMLIEGIKEVSTNTNVFYSSPSCYLKAVHSKNLRWPTKTDDFFPYASDKDSYWTGYFTSRPALKRFERIGNNFLQVSKQLAVLSNTDAEELDPLKEAMGILQHHDAITGTEKQHVANDYAKILSDAIDKAKLIANNALRKLSGAHQKITFQSCLLLNITQCSLTENNDNFIITVYNSLSSYISYYVRIPVTKKDYQIYDPNGKALTIQYIPISNIIKQIPGRLSDARYELNFEASYIPPLGYKMYQVKYSHCSKNQETEIQNKKPKIHVEFSEGLLNSVSFNGLQLSLKQNFLYYAGKLKPLASGAYAFRPKFEHAFIISQHVIIKKYSGPLFTEYHQEFNDWISQIIRIYHNEEYIEFNWFAGPVAPKNQHSIEIISRFTTNLKNNGVFYTDSNGREMIKRKRNLSKSVASNYYPVTSKISIKDDKQKLQMSILNDRSQGGSSLQDGEIELMIHRHLLRDDGFGVGESLLETAYDKGLVVTGKHYLVLGKINEEPSPAFREKKLEQEVLLEPKLFITPICDTIKNLQREFSGLKKKLPKNVHILTLEPWMNDAILLRLEHVFERNEDRIHSCPIKINLENLFSTIKIKKIEEMTLGANQLLSRMHRLSWKTEYNDEINSNTNNFICKHQISEHPMEIVLHPMQIRTFIVTPN